SGDHRSFQVWMPPGTAALLYTTPKKNLYHPTYSGLTRLVGRYCALDSSEADSESLSPSFAARSAGMGLVAQTSTSRLLFCAFSCAKPSMVFWNKIGRAACRE